MDETGPTMGHMPSSRASFSGWWMTSLSAGQDSASLRFLDEALGMPGCLERLWWWAVLALVTGQTRSGAFMSKSG